MNEAISIRRELRPRDLEAILEMHARLYPREHGLDSDFLDMVEASIDKVTGRGFPREREGIWVVERGDVFLGSLALSEEGDGVAMVRWFLLDPSLRGSGLGRGMLDELIAEARAHGYSLLRLETFSLLEAAAHLYRSNGFEVVNTDTGPRWGREEISYQRYELDLLSSQSTTTTAPPLRGSPPPSTLPSASRATA